MNGQENACPVIKLKDIAFNDKSFRVLKDINDNVANTKSANDCPLFLPYGGLSEIEMIREECVRQNKQQLETMTLKKPLASVLFKKRSKRRNHCFNAEFERPVTRSQTNSSPAYPKRYFEEDVPDEYGIVGGENFKILRRSGPRNCRETHSVNAQNVTEENLMKVCYAVSEKQYSQLNGTSCHQCRQKTLDMKTICRSGFCVGLRGNFCGVCLLNRYGEDACEALKDPTWKCPPCRGICNCSICRNKSGRAATGPMLYTALESGFKSVSHYLMNKEKVLLLDHHVDL